MVANSKWIKSSEFKDSQRLDVVKFTHNRKNVFLAKMRMGGDMLPPINTLRAIKVINSQTGLKLRLISPPVAHGLANLGQTADNSKLFSKARDFFGECMAFPSSVLVCHNGVGMPLGSKIIYGKENMVFDVPTSTIIHFDTRPFKGKPLMLLALDACAQDFQKIGFFKFRLNIGAERLIPLDFGESGDLGKLRQKFGDLAEFCSALLDNAKSQMLDTWSEKPPFIGLAHFFGGSMDAPACQIAMEKNCSQEYLVVEVPEDQAKPVLEIKYSLSYLPTPELMISLR